MTAFQAYLIVNHLDPTALGAALAVKKQCDEQVGIFQATDGIHSSTPGSASLPNSLASQIIPGSDEPSEMVMAEANGLWSQVRANSLDTLDSIRRAVDYLGGQPGTRVLVLASGGFLAGTLGNEQDEIIRRALRAQVTINCLDARGLYSNELGDPLNEVPELQAIPLSLFQFQEDARATEGDEREAAMADLAQGTGGILFHNNNDLTLGFRQVGLSPAVTYDLSFNIPDVPHDGKFHSLKVRVTPNRHIIVQARRGYFAPAADAETASGAPSRLEDAMGAAMQSPTPRQSLPVTVRARKGTGPQGMEAVRLQFHVDLAHVLFVKQAGRQVNRIVFIAGLFNGAGQMVTGKRAEMDLTLRPDSWRALQAAGLNAGLSLYAAPAAYTVRVVVAEVNTGAMFAATVGPE